MNAKSKLKRVNQLLDLEPHNVIHTKAYVDQFSKICHKLLTQKGKQGGQIKSKDELTAYVGTIVGAVTRTLNGEPNPLKELYAQLRVSDIPNAKPEFDADPWDVTLEKLNHAKVNCPNPFGRLVATIYSYGYVLRVGEIFNTAVKHISGYNWLDLDTGIWMIVNHKNQSKGVRKFVVDRNLITEIRKFVNPKCPYLIHKTTMEPYYTQTLACIDLTDLPCCSQLRNSFEQFNWHQSRRSRQEKLYWSVDVLGHSEQTVHGHYTRNDVQAELRALNSDSYETSSD